MVAGLVHQEDRRIGGQQLRTEGQEFRSSGCWLVPTCSAVSLGAPRAKRPRMQPAEVLAREREGGREEGEGGSRTRRARRG